LFGEEKASPAEEGEPSSETTISENLVQRARKVYEQAQAAAQAGNWGKYGEKIKELERILDRLNQE
jgi:hypothetical protein